MLKQATLGRRQPCEDGTQVGTPNDRRTCGKHGKQRKGGMLRQIGLGKGGGTIQLLDGTPSNGKVGAPSNGKVGTPTNGKVGTPSQTGMVRQIGLITVGL